jgi:hypothetical protein
MPPASNGSQLGGANDALEAELVAADDMGNVHTIHDGDHVTLMRAPQGGHIILVGARVHTDDTCQLDATGSLRDTATNRVLGLDERTLYVDATGDGWAAPSQPASLSAMPNVAVCPTSATTAAVNGNPYQLELSIMLDGAQVADLEASVIPTCGADDGYCSTECGPSGGL